MYGTDDDLSIKRRALLGAVATVTSGTAGCFDDEGRNTPDNRGTDTSASCPIDWEPHALAPVFYGWRDYKVGDGSTWPLRVFFPSLGGSPPSADILKGCAEYPLILFAHGECVEDAGENYKAWKRLPATLARAGYIVAVPEIPWGGGAPNLGIGMKRIDELVDWMYESWEHRKWIFPGKSFMNVAGHSYGALLTARYAVENNVVSYAAISGAWDDHLNTLEAILELRIPKLFCRGGKRDIHSKIGERRWDAMAEPKHRAVFKDAGHWDFLSADWPSCKEEVGACSLTPSLTRDLVVMFFGKYMPSSGSIGEIPASLVPPELDLEGEKSRTASGYLRGFSRIEDSDCQVTLTWNRRTESGTQTVSG